jgi:hypothetical protein
MATSTLAQVAQFTSEGSDYASNVKEFIDALAVALRDKPDNASLVAMIEDEPAELGGVFDAHLGGLAEYIADRNGLPCPAWANKPNRFLSRPFFMGGARAHRMLLTTTTYCMRRRNLFCGRVSLDSLRATKASTQGA